MQTKPVTKNIQGLQLEVAFAENVKRITDQILATSDLDHILLDLRTEILSLLEGEDLTIFAFDSDKKEIFSKVPHLDSVEEIRLPITEQSLAGLCAKYLRPVNIADAYDLAELQGIHPSLLHDTSYDKRTGFKTTQVLTYPIVAENKYLMGVLQLLNKKSGARFTKKDEESVAEIAKALGIALFNLRKTTKKPPSKFDLLITSNRITQPELDNALAEAKKGGSDFDSVLIEKHKTPKLEIGKSLAQFYKCPYIEYGDRTIVDIELLKNLSIDYLKKNHWMPLKRDRTSIEILTDDPGDLDRVADIKRTFPGLTIRFAISLRRDIAQFLAAATGQGPGPGDPSNTRKLDENVSDILGELANEAQEEAAEDAGGGLD